MRFAQRQGLIRSMLYLLLVIAAEGTGLGQTPSSIDFSRDILPILSDNCFFCHGPDANHRQADLRLDVESAAHRSAIQPGAPDDSLLIKRIVSDDSDLRMPPADSGKSLTEDQVEHLRQWVESGAAYETHWALRPLRQPGVPANVHPIDYFIDENLARRNLKANAPADARTLLRRMTLDLTGLPPTMAHVKRFEQSCSEDRAAAIANTLDKLFQSPRYGERMAWDWLDAARYADTNGYQGDNERTMWPWRDWVIRAFNTNMPWDQFTREQIAGDLIPDATDEQILATAFCRNHMINGEGGRIPEENRVEYVMDMTETVGTLWMGMTLECCRCHDHKFDALSQRDYYALNAFFNQTPVTGEGGSGQTPPVLVWADEATQQKIRDSQSDLAQWSQRIGDFESRLFPRSEAQESGQQAPTASLPEHLRAILDKPVAERSAEDFQDLAAHFDKKAKKNDVGESVPAKVPDDENAKANTLRTAGPTDRASDRPTEQPATDGTSMYVRACQDYVRSKELLSKLKKGLPKVMVMKDRDKLRTTHVLRRGLYNQKGDVVTAGTPDCLLPFPEDSPANRLGLADWILAADNPLTARVTVNRFWNMLFGEGLVKTLEDFGVQGDYPSHPALLDWLAADFVASGWDVQHLLRRIMTSQAYQRSSHFTPLQWERDAENRWLSRGPRFRMPSWMLRDQALSVSGLLNTTLGGPSVNSYQPAGVWQEATFGKKTHEPSPGDAVHRRSLYIFWRRIVGPTIFFDSSKRQICDVKPTRTNTPLHALTTLNAPIYVESARALAERVLRESDDANQACQHAVQRVLLRDPTSLEQRIWNSSLERATDYFTRHPEAARQLLAHGYSPRDESIPPIQHAAMTAVCLNLLNLDETVTIE